MKTAKIKPADECIKVERTDEIGECFKNDEHYYRQDADKVLHVTTDLVNILPENHIEDSRINWGEEFEEITKEEFENSLRKTIESFYL